MSKLIYIVNTSLDGYIEDETGSFDWANPDRVHDFVTELLDSVGTHLYGRRLYETMAYFDAPVESLAAENRDFARLWQAADKIVFSQTLAGVTTRNTRLERRFEIETIRKLKQESKRDLMIGGPELAGVALKADLVDECHLFLNPIILGRGKPAFRGGLRRNLELRETTRFDTGVIHTYYRIRSSS
jgi:dihydrofolate reductase